MIVCADPDIFNVQIATRDQVPRNLKEVFAAGESKLHKASSKFKIPLMKVEQSTAKCAPLIVEKGAMDKYLGWVINVVYSLWEYECKAHVKKFDKPY